MHPNQEYTARLLARTILELDGLDQPRAGRFDRATMGQAMVTVQLEGMVKGIRREFWIDGAEIAADVERKLEEAAAKFDLGQYVAEVVAREVADMKRRIDQMVRARIESMVADAVHDKLDQSTRAMAATIASKVWENVWPQPTPNEKDRMNKEKKT